MEVDHLIIFSNDQGREADELVQFGLLEGSNRIHPGQGTRNRKFYFENFFLEIVWVNSESEITSKLTAPTKLWERSNHKKNGSSPFGLCLQNTDDLDDLFEDCLQYKPIYLAEGLSFDIITNEESSHLPWTCRLPFAPGIKKSHEPTDHPNGIRNLTKVVFGIKGGNHQNRLVKFLSKESKIAFEPYEDHHLTLEFDNKKRERAETFTSIPLTIKY